MSEYPEDIMKAAQKAIDHMPDLKAMMDPSQFWEVAEEAVAAAILAERERCKKKMIDISYDLRRQCDSLMDKWSDGLGYTFESKAAGAASWIVSDAATSIDVEISKLERGEA